MSLKKKVILNIKYLYRLIDYFYLYIYRNNLVYNIAIEDNIWTVEQYKIMRYNFFFANVNK